MGRSQRTQSQMGGVFSEETFYKDYDSVRGTGKD